MVIRSSTLRRRSITVLFTVIASISLLSSCSLQPERFKNIDKYLELVDYQSAGEVSFVFGTERNTFYADSTGVRYAIVGEDAYAILSERTSSIDSLKCKERETKTGVSTVCEAEETLRVVFEYQQDEPSNVTLQITDSMNGATDVF